MDPLTYSGSNFFRQRLILSTLSGRPITIRSIRESSDEPGLQECEHRFLKLLDILTNGSSIIVSETGTIVKFRPGLLHGGKLELDCGLHRSLGYYLEALLCLAPFCKIPLQITLKGITNSAEDPSVDAIKLASLPVLRKFLLNDEKLDLEISSRGLAPDGGGTVIFHCPVASRIRPVQFLDPGKVKRIRGVAYALRVSPSMASRMVDEAKGILLRFLPDVYIYVDSAKGKKSGKSPGYGLTLVAESTTGVFCCGEAVSRPSGSEEGFISPEDVAKQACYDLLEEIYRGGCVDSRSQSLACLFMTLGSADVSKIVMGPLSAYTMKFLSHIDDFLQLRMKLESGMNEKLHLGTHKVTLTCIGIGFANLSRAVT